VLQPALFAGLPAADEGQRWRDGHGSWATHRDPFTPARYRVAELPGDAPAAEFVRRHHYAGTYPAARLRYGLIDTATAELAGVAVLSVPAQAKVLTAAFPTLTPYTESLELGRFVLLDKVGWCGETWFLARVFRAAAQRGVRGVVSFSDPMARTGAAGQVVFAGHIGTIYQASNAAYCGRGTARRLLLLPDGQVLSARALQKVRAGERGHEYVERLLCAHGARPRRDGADRRRWLAGALDAARARPLAHPGNHRYCFRLGTPAQRRQVPLGLPAGAYPKAA
jgi:hypothetical protein